MAKSVKPKIVLYFLNGPQPSAEDQEAFVALSAEGNKVVYRNAKFINCGDNLEYFDCVEGAVPECYAEAAKRRGEPVEPPSGANERAAEVLAAKRAAKADAAAKAAKAADKAKKPVTPPAEPKPDANKAPGWNPPAWKPNA